MSAIKTTLAGGLFFLLPFGVLLFVIGEVLDLTLLVAEPVANLFRVEDIVGISVANLIAGALILLACYMAGLAARNTALSKASGAAEQTLTKVVPGYRFIRAQLEGVFGDSLSTDSRARAVMVAMGGFQRYGLEIARDSADGSAVVFLPGAPDPQTGIVVRVGADQIEPCAMSTADLVLFMKHYGSSAGGVTPD
jgi:uncharacterized membrane protein